MTTATNSFEGGTAGQTITAANSGGASGTAFTVDSGYTYSTTRAAHGAKSALCSGSALGQLSHAMSGSGTRWWRAYLYCSSWASGGTVGYLNTAGSATFFEVELTSTQVRLRHYNGTDLTTLATISQAPATSQWIRVEAQATNAATAAGEIRLYNSADSATPTGTATGSRSQPVAAWSSADYGPTFPPADLWLDDVGWSDEGWLGAVAPPAVPRIQPPPPTAVHHASGW